MDDEMAERSGEYELEIPACFMNHSCDPNTFDEVKPDPHHHGSRDFLSQCIAARVIEEGEEITTDYDLFDWEFEGEGSFDCHCSSALCRGRVGGFSNLTADQKESMKGRASPAVRRLLQSEARRRCHCAVS